MRLVRMLSLDVVAGGLAGAALAARMAAAPMPAAFWWVLAGAIWVVYTLDHRIDARRAGPHAANPRHGFHARHARALGVAMGLVALTSFAGGTLLLPTRVLAAAPAIGALAALHMVGVRRGFPAWFPKELSVALIYSAGVWAGPLLIGTRLDLWTWAGFVLHAVAAFVYLLLYAWYEAVIDAADGSPSLAVRWGRERLGVMLTGLIVGASVVAVAAAVLAPASRRPAAWALAALVAAAWPFVRFDRFFAERRRYRYAELAFLVLFVPLLFARMP